MLFRKKPIVVEAFQWKGEEVVGIEDIYSMLAGPDKRPVLCINTLEGVMIASYGDYIITGIKGERYPCREDIFLATYEPVENTDQGEKNDDS